ncbi:hypothetical protein AAFC00_000502 [Neodothiora populina]|uniref:Uncharacterized protein n=1 Tax=Neodothiora populina TaxID=2781224 RepID=A0ABR3PD35_9PEZI
MPFREKLKKALHLDHDESPPASPDSKRQSTYTVQSNRHEDSRHNSSPRSGHRPLSDSRHDNSSSPTSSNSHNALGIDRGNPANPSGSLSDADQRNTATTNGKAVRRSEDVVGSSRLPGSGREGRYSEDVADWNITQGHRNDHSSAVPAPLQLNKDGDRHAQRTSAARSGAPARERLVDNVPKSVVPDGRRESISRKAVKDPKLATANGHHLEHKTSSPDLKATGSLGSVPISAETPRRNMEAPVGSTDRRFIVEDAAEPPSLEGVVDLSNTMDTNVEEKWAPAVTHNTINREVHHIREEVVTREIHYHDVYHRILPIIDIEVLPARHFVPDGKGGKIEITEDEIPGRTGPYHRTWAIVENVSKTEPIRGPIRFSARKFHGDEGQYKEYMSAAGVPTTETTWIHPPVLEQYSEFTGQTEPFYFGSEDPRDDGLRIYAPTGPITGSSRLHAEQMRATMGPSSEDTGRLSLHDTSSGPSPLQKTSRAGISDTIDGRSTQTA